MKLVKRLRASRGGDPPAGGERWTGGQRLLTTALSGVFCAALAAGPAGLALSVLNTVSDAHRPPPAPAAVDRSSDRAAATAFAGEFVTTWLETKQGQEARLREFIQVTGWAAPERPPSARDAVASAVVYVGSGVWAVTVSVIVSTPPPSATAVRRYFQVPVRIASGGALVAETLPAPVAAPGTADAPGLGYGNPVALTSPVGLAVSQFLSALLAGRSDVTRLVSPGSVIDPVVPPPYSAVAVSDLSADRAVPASSAPRQGDARVRVLVTAAGTFSGDQSASVQYALTLAPRSGRWEVASIDQAPPLRPGQ